jgi:hypothetical protein
MHEGVLRRMQECVLNDRLIIPSHAASAMDQDLLTREDIEHCILVGDIVERQWDKKYREYKYVIGGEAEDGSAMDVVAKLHKVGDTYVITVYRVY